MAERMRNFAKIGDRYGVELSEVWEKYKWGSYYEDEYFIEDEAAAGQKKSLFGKYSFVDDADAFFGALDQRMNQVRSVLDDAGARYEEDCSYDYVSGSGKIARYVSKKRRLDFTLGNGNRRGFVRSACAVTRSVAIEHLRSLSLRKFESPSERLTAKMQSKLVRDTLWVLRDEKHSRPSEEVDLRIEFSGAAICVGKNGEDFEDNIFAMCSFTDSSYDMSSFPIKWGLIKVALEEMLAAIDGIGFPAAVEINDLRNIEDSYGDLVPTVCLRVYFG
jgi:hypothetical protein